jgi:hypothetical protein
MAIIRYGCMLIDCSAHLSDVVFSRFVNGLVDPAQQGLYARSIATIAHQLDLPIFFVQLRHSATHEDLPNLEVLRSGGKQVVYWYYLFSLPFPSDTCNMQALDWLYERYWIPQVHSLRGLSTSTLDDGLDKAIGLLLKSYKAMRKMAVRDATKDNAIASERLYQRFERWIVEAGTTLLGAQGGSADDSANLALEALIAKMLEPGFLVPVSKKFISYLCVYFIVPYMGSILESVLRLAILRFPRNCRLFGCLFSTGSRALFNSFIAYSSLAYSTV